MDFTPDYSFTVYVRNVISDDLDTELQDALSEEMKKSGLL